MQTVSPAWKENQKQTLVSESFVEITIETTDPEALTDAEASDSGGMWFSDTWQVLRASELNINPYATLERNIWSLGGNRLALPVPGHDNAGFVGDALCDGDGVFFTAPLITIDFSSVHESLIQGVTITWGEVFGEYAADFAVHAYNGPDMVASRRMIDNRDTVSVVEMDIKNYDKIVIQVHAWSVPGRRARIHQGLFYKVQAVDVRRPAFRFPA